jgi:hypothetical protein
MEHVEEPALWAERHVRGAELSHIGRVERVIAIAEAMARKPGASIPKLFATWYDVKAAYGLFKHPEASVDALQSGHRQRTLDTLSEPGTYLLIEDTTALSYSHRPDRVEGLGQIGNGREGLQGFYAHSVLGVEWLGGTAEAPARRPAVRIVGLADQQYYVRLERPEAQQKQDSQERKTRDRESERWPLSSRRVGPAPEGVRWIEVADREADIYENLTESAAPGHGFVIRALQNRALVRTRAGVSGGLFEVARAASGRGRYQVDLRSRGRAPARTATVQVSWKRVRIRSPWRPGFSPGSLPPIRCTVVRAWEADPPEGVEALEWILLVDAPSTRLEHALTCVAHYATRFLIEDFHKALKTGLKAERLQLETRRALEAAVAIKSVVALRLVTLREQARITPEGEAAESGLDELERRVLSEVTGRKLTTAREVALALGRLGGHLNRARDGMPGWQTLWDRMHELMSLVRGVHLARKLIDSG